MTVQEKASIIRGLLSCIVVCEYQLIKLKDGSKQDLKQRINNAINSCKRVQDWFYERSDWETKETFKREFLSSEIVLMTELFELMATIKEEGLEEIISSIRQAIEPVNNIQS